MRQRSMMHGMPAAAARPPAAGSTTPTCSQIRRGCTAIASSTIAPANSLRRNTSTTSMEPAADVVDVRSEEHTSELQSQSNLVCRLLLEKKKKKYVRLAQ